MIRFLLFFLLVGASLCAQEPPPDRFFDWSAAAHYQVGGLGDDTPDLLGKPNSILLEAEARFSPRFGIIFQAGSDYVARQFRDSDRGFQFEASLHRRLVGLGGRVSQRIGSGEFSLDVTVNYGRTMLRKYYPRGDFTQIRAIGPNGTTIPIAPQGFTGVSRFTYDPLYQLGFRFGLHYTHWLSRKYALRLGGFSARTEVGSSGQRLKNEQREDFGRMVDSRNTAGGFRIEETSGVDQLGNQVAHGLSFGVVVKISK